MKGGTTTNVIPEYAECDIDVRFLTLDEARRIEKAIRGLTPVDGRVSLEITGEIKSASREQASGIQQVNQAVTQMDQVTQQNAALVEEVSAASASLQEQAVGLSRAVSVFKIEGRLEATLEGLEEPVADAGLALPKEERLALLAGAR